MARLQVDGYPPIDAPAGLSLLDACESHGIPMESACGGFAACNSCRVDVLDGGVHLSELQHEEGPFLDVDGQRLGCQARLLGGPVHVRLAPGM